MYIDLLKYNLILIITYLGLAAGIILSYIAKEEIRVGKKYLQLLQKLLLTLIVFFTLYVFSINLIVVIVISVVIVLLLLFIKNIHQQYVYALLGLFYWISSKNINFFIIISSLIFLYGFPTGSLMRKAEKKSIRQILTMTFYYLIVGFLLYFIP